METPLPNPVIGPRPLLLTAVICEDDALSNRDGSLSLQRVFYGFTPAALPAYKDFVVVGLWWLRGAGQGVLSTRVLGLDGGVLEELAREVAYTGQTIHAESARFVRLEVPASGTYRVEVLLDGEVVGAYPLFVDAPAPIGTTPAALVEPTVTETLVG